jgi:uncharacterized lipoprotein YddW (UPF0748 family)
MLISQALFFCKIPASKKHEIRAVWMSRFEYAEDKTPHQSQDYIRGEFKRFREAGLNLIIFQIRGNADAFYKSKYEPWSDMLTGELGKDPGWDPLQFAIDEAHLLGLELHVWINTFPAWKAENPPPTGSIPLHPLLAHPEWVVCDSAGQPMNPPAGYITFSPGIPEVQEHIRKVVDDIVTAYDVDGVHFDYIRYPEGAERLGYSHDSVSVHRFACREENAQQLAWDVWQREQIDRMVSDIYNAVTAAKPWVKVSAAVIGHYSDVGWNGFHAVYQDAQRWLATGKMDMIFPMTYSSINHPTAPYTLAIDQWKFMRHLGRYIIPGVATYKVGEEYKWNEVWMQVNLLREQGFPGMVFFSATSLTAGLEQLSARYYPQPALLPAMPWKKGVPAAQIENLQCVVRGDSLLITWQANNPASCFVIYHHAEAANAQSIEALLPAHCARYSIKYQAQSYYISAVNRIGQESPLLEIKLVSVAHPIARDTLALD